MASYRIEGDPWEGKKDFKRIRPPGGTRQIRGGKDSCTGNKTSKKGGGGSENGEDEKKRVLKKGRKFQNFFKRGDFWKESNF